MPAVGLSAVEKILTSLLYGSEGDDRHEESAESQ